MNNNPNLLGLYIGLAVGLIFALFTLIRHRKAPEFTAVAVIILSTAGAIVGVHLGYVVLTIDDKGLGELAQHRLPVILGALAVVWTALGSLCKTCSQALSDIEKELTSRPS